MIFDIQKLNREQQSSITISLAIMEVISDKVDPTHVSWVGLREQIIKTGKAATPIEIDCLQASIKAIIKLLLEPTTKDAVEQAYNIMTTSLEFSAFKAALVEVELMLKPYCDYVENYFKTIKDFESNTTNLPQYLN